MAGLRRALFRELRAGNMAGVGAVSLLAILVF